MGDFVTLVKSGHLNEGLQNILYGEPKSRQYDPKYVKFGPDGKKLSTTSAPAPAAAAAGAAAPPEVITGDIGTYGLNSTVKTSKSSKRGRFSTLLTGLGESPEVLGG